MIKALYPLFALLLLHTLAGYATIISGSANVCAGRTTTLTIDTTGGTWSSGTPGNASVDPTTGVITGHIAGTAVISYNLPAATFTRIVTIYTQPPAITGADVMCEGLFVNLNNTMGPVGAFTSGNTSVATVVPNGKVTGVSAGTALISYTVATSGCFATREVTVNPLPTPISNPGAVCPGATTTLNSAPGGGTWLSNNPSVATINPSTGELTSISGGMGSYYLTVITYTLPTGCRRVAQVTVNSSPGSIIGTLTMCSGSTSTLTCGTPGGVWSSSNAPVATISAAGVVSAISNGISTISYTTGSGCGNSVVVTVNTGISANTGTATVCVGQTTTLSNSTPTGTWFSDNTSIASVNTSTGVVSGVSGGTANITYTVGAGCTAVTQVTVNSAVAAITGNTSICLSGSTTLAYPVPGGTWSSSNVAVATIDATSGAVTPITSGTTTVTYTVSPGCFKTIHVTILPLPGAISGPATVCQGSTITLSSSPAGGAWTSGSANAAVTPSTGIVTGSAPGTSLISYTIGGSCRVTYEVSVHPLPAAISGSTTVCTGGSTTLTSDGTGIWSSSVTAKATVNASSGIVAGISAGTSVISYEFGNGCFRTTTVTVTGAPAAITGSLTICNGNTTTLSAATSGKVWVSANTAVATVDATSGVVTAISAGNAAISYTVGSCAAAPVTVTVTAGPPANEGTPFICIGPNVVLLTNTTQGGTWSASNTKVAINGASGLIKGKTVGTVNISYSTGTGCYAITTITVNAAMPAITGPTTVCPDGQVTLANTFPGGTWSSSNTAKATVDEATGEVTGISAGISTMTYMAGPGCFTSRTQSTSTPPASITGTAAMCEGTSSDLNISTGGGTWSSGDPTKATVHLTTGLVAGIAPGTAGITYRVTSTGCTSVREVTINPTPTTITGSLNVCVNSTTTLNIASTGGVWSCNWPVRATIDPVSGVVTGMNAGTAVISYTLGEGCYSTTVIDVLALPAAITGLTTVCPGSTISLTSATAGGNWSSSNEDAATVALASGVVTGVNTGSANITYTIVSSGCYATTAIAVSGGADAGTISGATTMNTGGSLSLTTSGSGGVWTSSNAAIASVNASGQVSGLTAGTVVIMYTVGSSCGSATATHTINVNAVTVPITGSAVVCQGSTTLLSNTNLGGSWTSANPDIATVSAGTVAGILPGTATISYTIPGGTVTKIVTVLPLPDAGTIEGEHVMNTGGAISLTNGAPGGSWSSSDIAVASVSAGGAVTGFTPGTVVISYTVSNSCGTNVATHTITVNAATVPITGVATVCAGSTTLLSNENTGGSWSSSNPEVASVDGDGIVTAFSAGTTIISYLLVVAGDTHYTTKEITVTETPTISLSSTHLVSVAGATAALPFSATTGSPQYSLTWDSSAESVGFLGTPYMISVFAGNGSAGYSGDGGPATAAQLSGPAGLAIDNANNLYIAEIYNSRIRKVSPSGIISTVAGNGSLAYSGDGGPATAASLYYPVDVTADENGNLYIVDQGNVVVRKVAPSGIISTIAGNGSFYYTGEGGPATATGLTGGLWFVATDLNGNIFFSCEGSHIVLKVTPSGVISTVAGNGTLGYFGDGGPATGTGLSGPYGLSTDGAGNLYIVNAYSDHSAILKVTLDGIISTVWEPTGCFDVTTDIVGNLYTNGDRIRKMTPYGTVTSIAGNGSYETSGDDGPATAAGIPSHSLVIDAIGNIYVSDPGVNNIRRISNITSLPPSQISVTVPLTVDTGTYHGAVTVYNGQCSNTYPITVTIIGPINGLDQMCSGNSASFSNITPGGNWTSSNAEVANVNEDGLVTAISTGTTTISYTVLGGTATKTVTVLALPDAGTILGAATVVVGDTIGLANAAEGGVWSSSSPDIATVNSSGMVTCIAVGSVQISYTVTNSCGSVSATKIITINPAPGMSCPSSWAEVGDDGIPALSNGNGSDFRSGLVLDDNGLPYVAYLENSATGSIKVKKFNGSVWIPIGADGFSGGYPDAIYIGDVPEGVTIGLDENTPYIAYSDYLSSSKITVKKFDGSNWVTVGTAGFSDAGVTNPSLAIGTTGIPYVAYTDGAHGNKATVMKFNGSEWVNVGSIGFSDGAVSNLSIVLGEDATPYVAYSDSSYGVKATVMKFDSENWVSVGTPGFSEGGSNYTSIALNGVGTPYVAYKDGANANKATVMKYSGSAWIAVGSPGISLAAATNISIAISSDGIPYVAYNDSSNGKVTAMKYVDESWVVVGNPVFTAQYGQLSKIAIDPNGTVFAAGRANWDVAVDRFNGAIWEPLSMVPGQGVTMFSSVALDNAGNPYLAFVENNARIKKFNGNEWEDLGSVGISDGSVSYANFSIAISEDDIPYFAYRDEANDSKVTVKKFNGTSWETVGSSGFSATWVDQTTIAFDGNTPYVLYQTGTEGGGYLTNVMKYNGSSWIELGSGSFSTSYGAGFAIDQTGTLYVSFGDPGNENRLTVVKYSGTDWEVVGGGSISTNAADYSSIAIDDNGDIYVACNTNIGELLVKKFNGSTWETLGDVGPSMSTFAASVAINSNSIPFVAYVAADGITVKQYLDNTWTTVGNPLFSSFILWGGEPLTLVFDHNDIPYLSLLAGDYVDAAVVLKFDTATILGVKKVCQGQITPLTFGSGGGGTWTSSIPSIASINSLGVVTGISPGTTNITFTTGDDCFKSVVVTVNTSPNAGFVTGPSDVPISSTATLSTTSPGGIWGSSNSLKAEVDATTGLVTGISEGVVIITYAQSNACGLAYATHELTVSGAAKLSNSYALDNSVNNMFTIAPNPTSGSLAIKSGVAGELILYTIDGREVTRKDVQTTGTTTLSLPPNLAAGVYMFRFKGTDGSSKMGRLVYQP